MILWRPRLLPSLLIGLSLSNGEMQDNWAGADPGFQVRGGGGALKKIAPSGGRRENFWGISCEKSRFYAKKILFFPILGGGARRVRPPPPESAPVGGVSYHVFKKLFDSLCKLYYGIHVFMYLYYSIQFGFVAFSLVLVDTLPTHPPWAIRVEFQFITYNGKW